MGNCLVTKLKEVVNNDNLRYLGELRVSCLEHENPTPATTATGVEGTNLSVKVLKGTMSDAQHLSPGGTAIYTPVYNVTSIATWGYSSKCYVETSLETLLRYAENLTTVYATFGGTQDIDEIMKYDFVSQVGMMVIKSTARLTIDNLDFTKLPNITSIQIDDARLTGNVVHFTESSTLNSFIIGNSSAYSFTGTVEDLAEAFVAKGRTTNFTISRFVPRRNGATTASNWVITFDSSYQGGYNITEA